MAHRIPVAGLRAILGLVTVRNGGGTALRVEPGATVGEVTAWLIERRLQLACTLEMEDATIGGLCMATGMTTHSHVCGLIHDTVVAFEVVTGKGEIVRAEPDGEHAALFRALPWSHGSAGFLVAVELNVVPSKRYVRMSYTPLRSRSAYVAAYDAALSRSPPPFFLEMLVFSAEEAVLMEGELADDAGDAPVNRAGLWYKPWFFKHVEGKLNGGRDCALRESLPMYDYLMRHDRSMCMTMGTVIPFGNEWWFRWMLGWLTPPKMSFLKGSHTAETREASAREQVYQDVAFPQERFSEALSLADQLFGIYPLMVYPARIHDHGGMLRLNAQNKNGSAIFLNLGIYGVPRRIREGQPCRTVHRVRELESWIRRVGGFQHTYCDSFQTRDEFHTMFNHTLLSDVRKQYGATGDFSDPYDRTRPEVNWQSWLKEEQAIADDVATR